MAEKVKGTVVIDPGHGGTFEVGGSSWNNAISFSGIPEKAMTLQIGLLIRDAIRTSNNSGKTDIKVVMTRDSDVNLGLQDRAHVARDKKADIFLSIHFNGFDKRARGVETLIRPKINGNVNHDEDRAFADRIQKAVLGVIKKHDNGTKDRGVKDQRLAVLNDAALGNTSENHPCRACLVEIEFIDVEAVDKLLNTSPSAPTIRAEIAAAIQGAIVEEMRNKELRTGRVEA